ncbi:MAG TPA: choice-of-anchor Q domain-containing protein [Gemmatimonadales bacterium]|nr:choice-of-anchor Q domain-containing protein [Gemmatimonadales bacterium]
MTLGCSLVIGLAACGGATSPKQTRAPRNFYVDANFGDNAASGDSAHPFQTIQHAADLVIPGDVVVVENGVYTSGGSVVDIERGGTAGHYVVFRAAVQWGAVIDGGQTSHTQPNGAENGVYLGASFVRVEGFEIRNVWHDGISPASGVSDFQIVGNHIHDVGRYCETSDIGLSGMTFINDNVVIEQNVIHDIGRDSTGENGCNPGNTYWQNHDHGIYLDTGANVIVRNNVFYNITRGWAVQCYPGPLSQIYVANNTFAFPNPHEDGQIIVAATLTTGAIVNNIFYQPQTAGVWFDAATTSGVAVQYNLTMGGPASTGSGAGVTLSNNLDNTDPMFVDALGFNFQLTAGSPAIDAGATLSYVTNDFLGMSRPQGAAYDIGAFEFH